MQGRVAGFFMTLFMALPLAAIPLMSIFGIPQLGSLAAPMEETGFLLEDPAANSDPSADAWDLSSAPAFGSSSSAEQPRLGDSVTAQANGSSSANSLDAAFLNSSGNGNSATAPQQGQVAPLSGSQPRLTDGNLSWEQALQRLAQFGITDYRLQPGSNAQGFHFACYSRGSAAGGQQPAAARTVIRFESEAADPLQAIQQTLQQVEKWHGGQQLQHNKIPLL